MRRLLLVLALAGCTLDDSNTNDESFESRRCFDMAAHAKNGLFDEELYIRCRTGHASAGDASEAGGEGAR
jgi:hypothetical protein